jgi:hypothetical protein
MSFLRSECGVLYESGVNGLITGAKQGGNMSDVPFEVGGEDVVGDLTEVK